MAAPFHDEGDSQGGARGRGRDLALTLLVFLVALIAYLRTMRPSFGWGDSSELITAAYHLGIGHSPGYPSWMLIAYPFAHLPMGDVAFRVNFMNALLGAVGAGLVYLVCRTISGSRPAGFVAALAFAFSRTFWDVTAEADVFTLHVCLASAIMLVALGWRRGAGWGPVPARAGGHAEACPSCCTTGQEANCCRTAGREASCCRTGQRTGGEGWLYLLAWLVGISLGNHALTLLMVPALVYLVWAHRGGRHFLHRRSLVCAGLLLVGLSVYALLPIRGAANPPPHVNNPHSLGEVWRQMTAPGARESMFEMGPVVALARAWAHLRGLAGEFGLAGVAMGLLGAGALWRRDRRMLAFLLLIAAISVGYACNFNIFDIYTYYLPLHMVWAAFIAVGGALIVAVGARAIERAQRGAASLTPEWRRGLVAALLLALPMTSFTDHFASVDRSEDYAPERFSRAVFAQVEPGAMVLGDWWVIAPLGYLKYVEGERRDVALVPMAAIASEEKFIAGMTDESVVGHPNVYFAEMISHRAKLIEELGFRLVPQGPVFRVLASRPDPDTLLADMPATPRARFGDEVGLVSAEVEEGVLRPGGCLGLTLYWTPLAGRREGRYQVILLLENEEAGRVWQEIAYLGHDLYPLERWREGQVLGERHRIYLAQPVAPGSYELVVRVRPKGTPVSLACDRPAPGHRARDHRVARVEIGEAGKPSGEGRFPAVFAWLRP